MAKTVAVLGRQPALGLAELESLFGADKIQRLGGSAILNIEPDNLPMQHLGGTIKAARYLTELPYSDWGKLEKYLSVELPKHTCCVVEGKIRLGLSVYGFDINPRRLNATGLVLKKAVREGGRSSVRVVPNTAPELNTAQVIHNQLTGPTGFEILLIKNGPNTVLAQTFSVQDIDAYAARDQKRPRRDARVGMLPPKLAQIIINLARPKPGARILDPFCGTGVVLQEALLMGYQTYGTDIEARMIEYSRINLDWLGADTGNWQLETADATEHQWQPFDAVACETYLGRPLATLPTPEKLAKITQDVSTIHKKFLQNIARQTEPGFRMCIAVPAWKVKNHFKHLPTLDSLEDLGYTRINFVHAPQDTLIYHRPEQIVGRELVVLQRK